MAFGPGDVIHLESDGAVRIVTLNRPDQLNAFSDDLHTEFPRLWMHLERDREARAVVLTGAGRAFSAGGSIDDFEHFANDLEARRQTLRDGRRVFEEMVNFKLPVVGAINGPAVGLGATVATLCDIVFLAETAYIADPHVQVALVAGDGGAVTWPYMTSILKAKQYLLTGDRIPAAEAVAMGLANFVVPADELMPQALAFARRLAELPHQAVQDTKLVINHHLRQAGASMLPYGLATESQSHDTADYRAVPEKFRARKK